MGEGQDGGDRPNAKPVVPPLQTRRSREGGNLAPIPTS